MAVTGDRAGIVAAARDAGVVGAGGAGFPTHIKLNTDADTVLVNCAECEPLLRVDQLLAESGADGVVAGLVIAMRATNARRGIIGIKAKYGGAEAALRSAIGSMGVDAVVTIGHLPDMYPAGDEHVLTHELTGRVIPQGSLPAAVGAVVMNPETLNNLADAMVGVPVTRTWLTLCGAVRKPCTVSVPLGMAMSDVINALGGPARQGCALIEGGPMMGRLVNDWSEPVTKRTKGLLLLPPENPVVDEKRRELSHAVKRTAGACDQCRNCTDLCPRYLLGHDLQPHMVLRAVNNGLPSPGLLTQASLCSECGLCSLAACPVGLHPRRINAELKREFARQGYPYRPDKRVMETPRPERTGRLFPVKRLVGLLGLGEYDVPAPIHHTDLVPDSVRIPLRQHVGAPAKPIVAVGDRVVVGQPLAEAAPGVSARVHSSMAGVVRSVGSEIEIRRDW